MYNPNSTTWSYNQRYSSANAYISVRKNRLKIYEGNKIYLKDGSEFEIEFRNDSTHKVRAEISINGKKQFYSLVLNPGVHFFLDRFMDNDKKLKFNTFTTGNDDIEALKEIIKQNGQIEIKFYREYQPIQFMPTIDTSTWFGSNSTTERVGNACFTSLINNMEKMSQKNTTLGFDEQSSKAVEYSCAVNNFTPDGLVKDTTRSFGKKLKKSVEVETGRVEEGNDSSQRFETSHDSFEFYPFVTVSYSILPLSQKPVEQKPKDYIVADSKNFRAYCQTCGRRVKKGYQFCPGCGTRF